MSRKMKKIVKTPRISPTLYMTDTLETTLCIIKPDAMPKRLEILRRIIKKGFHILIRKRFQLLPEQAAEFYQEYESQGTYMLMVLNISNGPIEVAILTKEDAIDDFIGLIGPEKPSMARCMCPGSLRAVYGSCCDDMKNSIHGSLSPEAALREIHFFFPNFIVEPLTRDMAKKLCCRRGFIDPFMKGLQQLAKTQPTEPIIWTAKWLLSNNPQKPLIEELTVEHYVVQEDEIPEKLQGKEDDKQDTSTKTTSGTLSTEATSSLLASTSTIVCSCASGKSTTSSSVGNLAKVICCCNIEVKPGEVAVCPVCDKILEYTVPVKPSSTDSTSSSASLSSSSNTSNAVSVRRKIVLPAKPAPICGAKPICGTCLPASSSESSPYSTEASSHPSKPDSSASDILKEIIKKCVESESTTNAE